jgi:hypothetical protein
MSEVFGPLDFLPDRVARGDVRVHPTRAAERANAKLAPLVEALDGLKAAYEAPTVLTYGGSIKRVLAAYEALSKETP